MSKEDKIREMKKEENYFDSRFWERKEQKPDFEEPEEEVIEEGLREYKKQKEEEGIRSQVLSGSLKEETDNEEEETEEEGSSQTYEERFRCKIGEIVP